MVLSIKQSGFAALSPLYIVLAGYRTRITWLVLFILQAYCGAMVLAEERRPNILFMFTDDQPANCLGITGNLHIQTPNLDTLAQRGMLFRNAFVTTAICCSNRASILTGQHMYRHEIWDFIKPLSKEAFDQTYPALLRKAGYRTGYLGKFAVGNPQKSNPQLCLPADQFDFWYGFPQSINFRQEVDGQTRYLTEVMTEKAIEFMRSNPEGQPFCLTVAFKEPHGPFNYFDPDSPNIYEDVEISPSATFSQKDWDLQPSFLHESLNGDNGPTMLEDQDRLQQYLRTFYRTVTRADQAVGEILEEMEQLGLSDNTVVIFSSDHGSLLGDHGLTGKWLMYENSIRVPLIVFDPRVDSRKAGDKREEMVLSIDLAPTMLDLAGVEVPVSMQGKSMMPLIRGESTEWRSRFYYEHVYNTNPPRSPIVKTEGIRTERWKYIRYPEIMPVFEQLFDLQTDPLERFNLAPNPDRAATLSKLRAVCDQDRRSL